MLPLRPSPLAFLTCVGYCEEWFLIMRARGIINDNDDDDDGDDDDDDVCVCGVRACACASVQNLVQYILLEQSCATLPISSKTQDHISF